MISIRKQLFSIFLSIGCIMVFSTSLIVNISIKKNFEIYIDNNIREAGNSIVAIVEKLYEKGELENNTMQQGLLENYMGNFAVTLLDRISNLYGERLNKAL